MAIPLTVGCKYQNDYSKKHMQEPQVITDTLNLKLSEFVSSGSITAACEYRYQLTASKNLVPCKFGCCKLYYQTSSHN